MSFWDTIRTWIRPTTQVLTPPAPAPRLALPELLERVGHLNFRARKLAAGLFQGTRPSIKLGRDLSFAEYKPYVPGDPIRDIDWRVHARNDRLVLRRYQAETEAGLVILLDTSADLASTPAKWEQAMLLAATLAHILHIEREPVGISIGPNLWLPPRASQTHLTRIFHAIADAKPLPNKISLDPWVRAIGDRLKPRSVVTIISDFAEEPEGWRKSFDALIARRADIRCFHLFDAQESSLRYDAPLRLFSPEDPAPKYPLDPDANRQDFETTFQGFCEEVAAATHRVGGLYTRVEAHEDLSEPLSRFLRGQGGVR